MKNGLKFLSVALVAFGLGLVASNYAMSDVPSDFKVAVVDVQKVVTNSSQVKALKEEQKKKASDFAKNIFFWLLSHISYKIRTNIVPHCHCVNNCTIKIDNK